MVRQSKKELNIIGSTNDRRRGRTGRPQRRREYDDFAYDEYELDYDDYDRSYDSYDSGYDDYDREYSGRRYIGYDRNDKGYDEYDDGYDEYDEYDEYDGYDDYDDGFDDYESRLRREEASYRALDKKIAANKKRSKEERRAARNNSYKDDKYYYEQSLHEHEYGRNPSRNGKKHKNKKLIILRNVGIIAVAVLVALFCVWKFVPGVKNAAVKSALKSSAGASVAQAMIGDDYNKNVLDKDFDKSKVAINAGVTAPEGYHSIALFGIDAREEGLTTPGSRSDSMMVVSVNEKTSEIKMASIYRDTFLLDSLNEYNEYYIGKANAAYALEGPLGAVNMLNRNWDLAITDYVVVNFGGLANIINELGGLTLEITDEEVEEINYRMDEQIQMFGGEYIKVENSGTVKLNGAQATAFCRIRAVDFHSPVDGQVYSNDFGRTARQRYALTEIMKQFKNLGVSKLVDVGNKICAGNVGSNKFIATSLSLSELMKFLSKVMDMNITGQEAFPVADHMHGAMLDCGDSLVADTLEENAGLLHRFLYNDMNYSPSGDLYTYANMISNAEIWQSANSGSGGGDDDNFNWEDVSYQTWEDSSGGSGGSQEGQPEQTEEPGNQETENTDETFNSGNEPDTELSGDTGAGEP